MKSDNQTMNRSGFVRRAAGPFGGLLACLTALALAVLGSGCAGTDPEAYNIPAEAFKSRPSSTLTAGDVIRVSYPGAPEMNLTQKIRANGKVSLPMVGDISAAGRTVSGLQSSLSGMYVNQLQDPTVLVSLEEPAAAVYVSGEVVTPGKVALDRPMTAFQAVMEAGGFSKLANPREVYVIRTEGGKQQRYALNMADTLGGGSQAFYVRPYDAIYVKASKW